MFRYEVVTGQVREWIVAGVLKPGDRLLSVREMSVKLGFSPVTVHQAYGMLQDEGLIEARPRSGFYIAEQSRQLPEFGDPLDGPPAEETSHGADFPLPRDRNQLLGGGLGSAFISDDLAPYDELYRLMVANLRWENAKLEMASWQGLDVLREAIVRRSATTASNARARDILVTSSLQSSVGVCLDLLVPEGAKILVETPTDTAIVSSVLSRNITPVEIYAHPRFGVDPEQFQYLMEHNDIAACIVSPCNHAPTGISYPLEVARRIAETASQHRVPIIENLSGQELAYGAVPYDLSQFDRRNTVVRVGGVIDSLGPRFGLGWISLPRRDHWKVELREPRLAGEWARQKALATFLSGRSYERHLRRLRETVGVRTRKGLALIFQHFPDNCTVSRPAGGYMCWIRGPKNFDSVASERLARERGTSFSPGPLFSVTRAFGNFIALNLSNPWTEEREQELVSLAGILAAG